MTKKAAILINFAIESGNKTCASLHSIKKPSPKNVLEQKINTSIKTKSIISKMNFNFCGIVKTYQLLFQMSIRNKIYSLSNDKGTKTKNKLKYPSSMQVG